MGEPGSRGWGEGEQTMVGKQGSRNVSKLVTSAPKSGSREMDAHIPPAFSFLFSQSPSPKNGVAHIYSGGWASHRHTHRLVCKMFVNPNQLTAEIGHYNRYACSVLHSDYSLCSPPSPHTHFTWGSQSYLDCRIFHSLQESSLSNLKGNAVKGERRQVK